MNLLYQITVSAPDTLAHSASHQTGAHYLCSNFMPVENTVAICITIILCLLIIAVTVRMCMKDMQNAKEEDLKGCATAEREKMGKELARQNDKERFELAWRIIEHDWKEGRKCASGNGSAADEDENVKKAWTYIHSILDKAK